MEAVAPAHSPPPAEQKRPTPSALPASPSATHGGPVSTGAPPSPAPAPAPSHTPLMHRVSPGLNEYPKNTHISRGNVIASFVVFCHRHSMRILSPFAKVSGSSTLKMSIGGWNTSWGA